MQWTNRFMSKLTPKRTEADWDEKLKISTGGRLEEHADDFHYPYEPTPYCVLERIAESGYLKKKHVLVDYGCGKGRVGFFFHHTIKCRTIGVEYDEPIWQQAMENLNNSGIKKGVAFVRTDAKDFPVEDADAFYFFNPFSIEIFRAVMERIIDSYYENPRKMRLFFYYPNDDYLSYLMTSYELMFLDEIDCRDLFEGNEPREKVLIFEIGSYE